MKAIEAALLAIAFAGTASSPPPVWIGRFTAAGAPPAPWRMQKMAGAPPTRYQVGSVAGKLAVEATVDRSMSLLTRPVTVDLGTTPIMCWRWYVDGPVLKADMTKRSGDDYAARVYVGFDVEDNALSQSTKLKLRMARAMFGNSIPDAAVVYVWDNRHAVGTARRSSYTDRVQLVVMETGAAHARRWVSERVDLASDFAKAFVGQPGKPVQVAVAADGDNTKSSGRAAFADIHFVRRGAPCVT